MKIKAALFYKGSIAFYIIHVIDEGLFKIKLDYYRGQVKPPEIIELYKKGKEFHSDCEDSELIKELCSAIEQNPELFYSAN